MTKSMPIPLASPRLSSDDIQAVVDVLNSGLLVCGSKVEEFERALAAYVGVRHAVCVSSGTAALHLGLHAFGIGPGCDVIVPALSFPATANVIELVGARPIFIDSEPGGFNINATKIENSITPATKAIIAVHNFGHPADMDRITEVALKYDLPVFEDAACALGSTFKGVRCGAIGDLATFSFHPGKIMTTGEGGAIVTNDTDIAQHVQELRNHGQRPGQIGAFRSPGFNYRMTDFQASLGHSQMRRYQSILFRRIKAARYYDDLIGGVSILRQTPKIASSRANYQSYVAYVKENGRDKLIEFLKCRAIGAGIGTYSIPHTDYYREKYNFTTSDFPNALRAFRCLLSLPLYDGITHEDQNRVIEALTDCHSTMRAVADEVATIQR